ncbi:type IV secretion system protein [Paraburkholderia sp. GAS33]|uniref:type IV secretion system protein n=1 Tax=Paraburkholderia sp. GAS33 TaxID=3035130 RepID=UPI003D1A5C86
MLATINTGSANLISLISPLAAAGFSLYVLLIMMSYWRGNNDQPIVDFFIRMMGWAAVLTAGMNIGYYSEYVVPFFNGIGDQIAQALTGSASSATALDTLLNAYLNSILSVWQGIEPYQIGVMVEAAAITCCTLLVGIPFLAVAAAYIILAKFALGLLLALGPMFVVSALFPATRRFFEAWVGQCLNYAFLTALFAAAGAIEVQFANGILPTAFTMGSLVLTWTLELKILSMGVVFLFVSLNLPSLASALAGGVGISSMVGKAFGTAGAVARALSRSGGGGGDKGKGGDLEAA